MKNCNERCWILIGGRSDKLWWAHCRKMTQGEISSVNFDANYVLTREETKGDILGMMHTHPHCSAQPSERDNRTMGSWVNCFGKSLLCIIKGIDGLRAWWYIDDENPSIECEVKKFGKLLFGTVVKLD